MSGSDAVAPPSDRRSRCPMCGASDLDRRPLREPELDRCRRCGLVYRVTPVRSLFTGDRTDDELDALAASRAQMFAAQLRRLGRPGGTLIDVGCGSGYFLELAANRGWRAAGLELDPSLAGHARAAGRRVVRADGEDAPLRTASAAAVTLWDVLDHFEAPRRAVAEAARILQPGGSLWLRVRHGTVHEMMRRQRWLPRGLSVLHNNLFSPGCLRLTLADAGFAKVRISPSPTSQGDPYASGKQWLRAAKRAWNVTARATAATSGGRIIVSPSLAVHAVRAADPPPRHG